MMLSPRLKRWCVMGADRQHVSLPNCLTLNSKRFSGSTFSESKKVRPLPAHQSHYVLVQRELEFRV